MSSSTSHKRKSNPHGRGSHHGGGGGDHGDGGGGGGGGGGRLVKVGFGRTQPEAEMLQGLLSEAGIASILKRSRGFDAPEFAGAGPHDVMVTEALAPRAREVLADTALEPESEEREELREAAALRKSGVSGPAPGRLALWLIGAALAALILVWVLYEIT